MGHHHSKNHNLDYHTKDIIEHVTTKRSQHTKDIDQDVSATKEKEHLAKTKSKESKILESLKSDATVGKALKLVPLFSSLSPKDRAAIGGALMASQFTGGEAIFEQGDPGEAFYIITQGTVSVDTKYEDSTGTHTKNISKLTTGDYFGESSLLTHTMRGATVTATTDVLCMTLEKEYFEALFVSKKIAVDWATRRVAVMSAERDSHVTQDLLRVVNDADKQKTDDDIKLIEGAVAENFVFAEMADKQRKAIIDEMYRVEFKEGDVVLKSGIINYYLYVVTAGKFNEENSDHPEWGDEEKLHGPGTAFGELALMHGTENHSQVKTLEDSTCWTIDRFTFQRIAKDFGSEKYDKHCAFLKQVETLKILSSFERSKIAEALEEISFGPNEGIMTKGEEGDSMYIVEDGEAVVYLHSDSDEKKEETRCVSGHYFGERALMTKEPRAATVVAGEKGCKCLKLDKDTFSVLLGPLQDIFKSRMDSYEKKEPEKEEEKEVVKKEWVPLDISMEDLKNVGTLGRGAFGFVTLVYDNRNPDNYYALKAVSKMEVVETKQETHIMSEKQTLCELQHPCLVNLVKTFKTRDQLFFLLEVGLGGDLFHILRKAHSFSESTARFYTASVVAGFAFMHSCKTVYRDLKPENLLVDHEGFLKITDFGFAKKIEGKTWTLCGTPEYLCPEIVAGKGHGFGVDWWTVGVLAFELLVGYTPFYDRDQMRMYRKITRGTFHTPSHVSHNAKDLIHQLLKLNPSMRLGVIKGGAQSIKEHPFFEGFSFDELVSREMTPPFKPKIKGRGNISAESNQRPQKYDSKRYGDWDKDF